MSFFNADILVSSTDGLLLKDLGDNATTPSSGYGSVYVNDDALYFKSDGGNTTNLLSSGGDSGISFSGSTANGLVTYGGTITADVESALTFTTSDSLNLKANSSKITFGVNNEITLTHVANKGLTLTENRSSGTEWGGADATETPSPGRGLLHIVQSWDGIGSPSYGPGNAFSIETSQEDTTKNYVGMGFAQGGAFRIRFSDTSLADCFSSSNYYGTSMGKSGLKIHSTSDNDNNKGLQLYSSGNTSDYWNINLWSNTDSDLNFSYIGSSKGFLDSSTNAGKIDFTGQHRSIMNNNITENSVGLIISSTGKYVNLDNTLNSNINESLPICEITSTDNDKKVFGVLSDKEDTETTRNYSAGNWGSVYTKQNTNEQRIYINSLGEGAIWVCNKNGNIDNGDYIASCTVPGYGVKQADDLLHNYTVAKLTCDCNFSTIKIVKQKLKVTSTTDSNGVTTTAIDYDANGDVRYENDLDGNGNQQMVYEHDTRFLQAGGTQITESDYTTRLGNGENVYIACFVGCTYHCG